MQSEAGVRWSEPTRAQYSKATKTKMEAAIVSAVNELEHILSLKDEQTIALKAFLEKKDVFAVLPTGYGKSVIFQLAPLLFTTSLTVQVCYVADCAALIGCWSKSNQ